MAKLMLLSTRLKLIKHRLLVARHRYFEAVKYEDAVADALAGIAGRWHGEIEPVYSYLAMLDILKQADIRGDGLEIGGGYSTILLCQLVDRNGMRIESVDVNPDKYLRIIPRGKVREFVFNRIQRVDKLSVSFAEIQKAYLDILPARIREFGSEKFTSCLKLFCEEACSHSNWIDITECTPESLGEQLLSLPLCREEKQFYIDNELVEGEGYCSKLIADERFFDFVFFDCGEYSSLAEWFLLENQIKVNGFVLLHDIYFPKSVKNFLVATLINLSDKWEVVYVDKISPQGALVARKVKS